MKARQLTISKQKGAIVNRQEMLTTIDYWLLSCGNGDYTLALTKRKQHRSISQNKLMWAWFACIAQAWTEATDRPFTPQDVHDAYCLMLLPKRTPKGNVGGSTSSLSTEQMTEFLNRVQADAAAEYGITLPNPDEQYFEAWYSQYQY